MLLLFRISKIQIFESKSQHDGKLNRSEICCSEYQRYKFLKANHNNSIMFALMFWVVYQIKDTIFWKQITTEFIYFFWVCELFIRSKIQFFESKSIYGHHTSTIPPVFISCDLKSIKSLIFVVFFMNFLLKYKIIFRKFATYFYDSYSQQRTSYRWHKSIHICVAAANTE